MADEKKEEVEVKVEQKKEVKNEKKERSFITNGIIWLLEAMVFIFFFVVMISSLEEINANWLFISFILAGFVVMRRLWIKLEPDTIFFWRILYYFLLVFSISGFFLIFFRQTALNVYFSWSVSYGRKIDFLRIFLPLLVLVASSTWMSITYKGRIIATVLISICWISVVLGMLNYELVPSFDMRVFLEKLKLKDKMTAENINLQKSLGTYMHIVKNNVEVYHNISKVTENGDIVKEEGEFFPQGAFLKILEPYPVSYDGKKFISAPYQNQGKAFVKVKYKGKEKYVLNDRRVESVDGSNYYEGDGYLLVKTDEKMTIKNVREEKLIVVPGKWDKPATFFTTSPYNDKLYALTPVGYVKIINGVRIEPTGKVLQLLVKPNMEVKGIF